MKLFTTITAATILACTSAIAGPLSGGLNADISGSASSLAVTGGGALGKGSTLQSAGNFAANRGSMEGGLAPTTGGVAGQHGRLEITVTNESYSEGFAKSDFSGSAMGGSLHLGGAEGRGDFTGWGAGDW